jgi:hypothetical protein
MMDNRAPDVLGTLRDDVRYGQGRVRRQGGERVWSTMLPLGLLTRDQSQQIAGVQGWWWSYSKLC